MVVRLCTVLICLFWLGSGSRADVSVPSEENPKIEFALAPQPIQAAFQMQLAADEWDQSPANKPKKVKNSESGQVSTKGKSRAKAIILSALLPGAGEYYVGQKSKATWFFVAEAVNIIGFVTFRTAASWKRDDYISYGISHAGAQMDGKPDEFYDMMGFYSGNLEYNTVGRVGDQDRPYYPDDEEYHWQWRSAEDQATFKELLNKEGQLIQRSKFMVGLAVLNRIVSIIDTAIGTRHMSGGGSEEFSSNESDRIDFAIKPTSTNHQVVLTWHTSLF